MPYYDIICGTCNDAIYIGEAPPAANSTTSWTCKRGHKVYASDRVAIRCGRSGCDGLVLLNGRLSDGASVTCNRCAKAIFANGGFYTTCVCNRMTSVSAVPTGNIFFTCDCGRSLNASSTWYILPAGVYADFQAGQVRPRQTENECLSNAGLSLTTGGALKQTQRIALIANNARYAAGICEGFCLHWIRRVLQGGRINYDTTSSKLGVERSATQSRTRQFGHAAAAAAMQDKAKQDGHRYTQWNQFARGADRQLAVEKDKQGNQVTRRFENIRVTKNIPDQPWASIDAFLNALFGDNAFTAPVTSAAVIGVGVRGTGEDRQTEISGHAIAVFRDPARSLYLVFDPNYGVFSALDIAALQRGVSTLIETVWTSFGSNPWQLTNTCSYAVFEPTVQPTQTINTPVTATFQALDLSAQGQLTTHTPTPAPSMQGPPQRPVVVESQTITVVLRPRVEQGATVVNPVTPPQNNPGPAQTAGPHATGPSVSQARNFWANQERK